MNTPKNTRGIEPHKFKKGQSGNLNGRPKKLPELDELLAEILGEGEDGKNGARAILNALLAKATRGDIRAAEVLLNRGYGLPRQKVDITEHMGIILIEGETDKRDEPIKD